MRFEAKILTWAVLLGAAVAANVSAQETAPDQEALEVLRRFVLVDCEVGDERSVTTDLVQLAEVLEPELGRLVLDGPDDAWLAETSATLERRWALRADYLDSTARSGLDDETLQDLLSVSREDFIERELRRFVLATREKAIVGLSEIGTRTAQRRLRQAIPVVQDDEVLEMLHDALKGRRLLERQQPATQRGTPFREDSRRGLD
jgi:hypothetical protein